MRKVLCIAMIVFLFVLGLSLNVNAKDKNLEKYRYSDFKHIKHFGRIMIGLIGSAESLELNRKDLKNYFLLKYKNNFSEVEYKPSILNESVKKSKFEKKM